MDIRLNDHSGKDRSGANQDSGAAIDFFFDFISPFGWIGAERIGEVARRFGRRLNWHPFLLKVTVVDTMGLTPPLETPLKGRYLLHDIKRSLRYHGLALSEHARFGFSSVAASRAVLWAQMTSAIDLQDIILALYRAHWAQGRDISHSETVLDVVEELGLSRAAAERALKDDSVKNALRQETQWAVEAGVFGSPTVIVDGESFWGSDRFDMLESWLETGGW